MTYTSFTPYKHCVLCNQPLVHSAPICPKGKDGKHEWTVKLRENYRNRSGRWLTWLFSWDALGRIFRR